MRQLNSWIGLLLTLVTVSACQNENPALTGPQRMPTPKANYQVAQTSANGLSITYDSRVDILFVIDDSRSMKAHQENLSRNINKFVDAFAKIKAIDFHVGFTHVHDRVRYGPIVPQVCGADTKTLTGISTAGRVNWEAPGSLKPLVDKNGAFPTATRRYLTKDDANFAEILRDSLDPKTNASLLKDYINPDPKKPWLCPYGPENEESFTPILGMFENPMLSSGVNKGFRRDGAFFVAIIVSDAKDESVNIGITPQEIVSRLTQYTHEATSNKKRFRIYSVVISPGTVIGKSHAPGVCKPDPAFADSTYDTPTEKGLPVFPDKRIVQEGENPLVEAARLTEDATSPKGGQVLSICSSDYGDALAAFGFQIQQDALTDLTLNLPHRPQNLDSANPDYQSKKLRVFIGNVELIEGKHWNYNPQDVSVVVYGNKVPWSEYPNEKIRITYTPVDDTLKTTRPLR